LDLHFKEAILNKLKLWIFLILFIVVQVVFWLVYFYFLPQLVFWAKESVTINILLTGTVVFFVGFDVVLGLGFAGSKLQ